MTPLHSHCRELDLHRLDLRFAASRLVEPQAVARLAESIERCGQIVPCIVVAVPGGEGGGLEALVLIDGYRRVAALRRLGRDTAGVEQWCCDLTRALLGVLARAQDRPFAIIEQALLLRELVQGQGLSQHEVAQRCGRDVSWVSRRLHLLSGLPDAALAAVRAGRLSSWAANRVVVLLALANAEHAERLLAALAGTPLTTRELRCWFERYQQAPRTARERMVRALVHLAHGGRDGPNPKPLCDDSLAADRVRASGRQHSIQDRHADGSLGLLGSETAGAQSRSDQRLVAAHRRFDQRALTIAGGRLPG